MAPPASLLWKCIQSPWQRENGSVSKILMASGKCRIKQAKIHFGPDAVVYNNINEYSPLKRIIIRILKSVNYILIINYNC